MYKSFLTIAALLVSTSSFASSNALTCQISGLNILNDEVISGSSQVRISDTDLKTQIFIEIDVTSTDGKTLNRTKYVDNISSESFEYASEISIPKFQYYYLSLVKNNSKYSLELTDDQTGQKHLAPIDCTLEKK